MKEWGRLSGDERMASVFGYVSLLCWIAAFVAFGIWLCLEW